MKVSHLSGSRWEMAFISPSDEARHHGCTVRLSTTDVGEQCFTLPKPSVVGLESSFSNSSGMIISDKRNKIKYAEISTAQKTSVFLTYLLHNCEVNFSQFPIFRHQLARGFLQLRNILFNLLKLIPSDTLTDVVQAAQDLRLRWFNQALESQGRIEHKGLLAWDHLTINRIVEMSNLQRQRKKTTLHDYIRRTPTGLPVAHRVGLLWYTQSGTGRKFSDCRTSQIVTYVPCPFTYK